ncbi:MAG: hypothetical protein HYU37_20205 [Acidobacteria bacterium]|nr:hypothetical protein [Acidobacteriota bacterium]
MATTLIDPKQAPPDVIGTDDPFHDPVLGGIAIVFVLLGLVIVLLTGLIHWGVEYRSPPWNANSYPPPVVHRW